MNIKNFTISGASGKPIAIDLYSDLSTENSPLVIFAHGFKGFKDWGTHHMVARYFVQRGFNFLKFNFSHNGISENSKDAFDDLEAFADNTFSKELFDLTQVIDFATSGEAGLLTSAIFLLGHSMGGAISIITAAEDSRIHKLCTWASISSFRNLWSAAQEVEWREKGFLNFINSRTNQQMPIKSSLLEDLEMNADRLDILKAAGHVGKRWLIINGSIDPAVPLHNAEILHQHQPGSELLIIENGDHVFGARHPWEAESLPKELKQVCDATIEFFHSAG